MVKYIHQLPDWPNFKWDSEVLSSKLAKIRHQQGRLVGRMETQGLQSQEQATLHMLTLNVLKSSEIEGEKLDKNQVHSSVARRLGLDVTGLPVASRHVDGVVEMIMDATRNYTKPLTKKRLFGWHSALFPNGYSGLLKIRVGKWRTDEKGPMQVISGPIGHETVHYEAPGADRIEQEMQLFTHWFNSQDSIDMVLKAGVAHLWFVTIHPFEDGNGRIARAIADMLLAKSEDTPYHFYSMSNEIIKEQREYYMQLEHTQKGDLDITEWLDWFLSCLGRAIESVEDVLKDILLKGRFWQQWNQYSFNERQKLMLNKLWDGFQGNLTSTKWAQIAKCSQDTALRDIRDLIDVGVLAKEPAGGRSTKYILVKEKHLP